jgi:hypothetical protein
MNTQTETTVLTLKKAKKIVNALKVTIQERKRANVKRKVVGQEVGVAKNTKVANTIGIEATRKIIKARCTKEIDGQTKIMKDEIEGSMKDQTGTNFKVNYKAKEMIQIRAGHLGLTVLLVKENCLKSLQWHKAKFQQLE